MIYYTLILVAVIVTIIVLNFIYKKTKSIRFINSFQLVDGILYRDKLPYSDMIRVSEVDGVRVYFDFDEGHLVRVSMYMKDGANANWRVDAKYITCFDREGHSISQGRFEALYSRFVDSDNMLEIFNRNFKKCQLAV